MREEALRDLAIYIASRPDAHCLTEHLATLTLGSLEPSTVCLFVKGDPPRQREAFLVGQRGLTPDEVAKYRCMDIDFPAPACLALRRSLPFSVSLAEFTEAFPLVPMRPGLPTDGDHVFIPITHQGLTHAVLAFTIPQPLAWGPNMWQNALALQALLGLYFDVADSPFAAAKSQARATASARSLSERQQEILHLVSEGKSTSYIAARLGFSESTIKQDVRRAMATLGVANRHQAVLRARELKLLPEAS